MKSVLFYLLFGILFILNPNLLQSQDDFYESNSFSQQDSLRGTLNAQRSCFDVGHYDIDIEIFPKSKSLEGTVTIQLVALQNFSRIQLDLFDNMKIDRVYHEQLGDLEFNRNGNAFFVNTGPVAKGEQRQLKIDYSGKPISTKNAPWDGGFVWEKDQHGSDWIAVACEGTGASLWWPNKDHLSDEPDSLDIKITVPGSLFANSNGNLQSTESLPKKRTKYHWKVNYPINNYNVTVNIGDYRHFSDVYIAADGDSLALDYYVLPYNVDKAKKHFEQVKPMLECYENYFGKYPFWKDGFALVETPYLGMEHQSAIAYGNQYQRGYKGGMIPLNMDWDYIIIHETGHEYFGNSVSVADHAEMWIHESFTTYMEALYVECMSGYEESIRYLNHFRNRIYIQNRKPIIGPQGVNWDNWESSDHYFKGSWILHTLRHVIGNDELWFELLKSFYTRNTRSIVSSDDFFSHVNEKTNKDFSAFFQQYFKYTDVPLLEYVLKEKKGIPILAYRWVTDVPNFEMTIEMGSPGNFKRITANNNWQETSWPGLSPEKFTIRKDLFLINVKNLKK